MIEIKIIFKFGRKILNYYEFYKYSNKNNNNKNNNNKNNSNKNNNKNNSNNKLINK